MLIIATKTVRRLYYDSESKMLTMPLPDIDHKAVISIWRKAMESIHDKLAPPEQLQEALNRVHCATPWMTRVLINNTDNSEWPDLLYSTKIGKNYRVDLGLLEVGGSQYLHGKQGVLAVVSNSILTHDLCSLCGSAA